MARSFNGIDQALVASSVDLSGVQTVSLAWWQYVDSWPVATVKLAFEFSPDTNGVTTGFNVQNFDSGNTGLIIVLIGDGVPGTNSGDYQPPSAAAWHHYVAICDKSQAVNEVDVYVDGTLLTATTRITNNNTNNFAVDELNFMSRNGASLWAPGRLAEVAVWNTILSGANITSLAGTLGVANSAALPSSIPTGLKGYWALLGTTSPEPDTSGNGHDATLVGTPTQVTHPIEPNYGTGATLMGAICM